MRVQCYVKGHVLEQLRGLARQRSVSVSQAARKLVIERLNALAASEKDTSEAPTERKSIGRPTHQINVRVSASAFERIGALAQASELTRGGWLAALVRREIEDTPQFPVAALEALTASNRQLWSIGTSLNQLAYAMNVELKARGCVDGAAIKVSLLQDLRRQIDSHTADATKVIETARDRRRGRRRVKTVSSQSSITKQESQPNQNYV